MINAASKKIIAEIVSIPTAPFHEHKVISYVARFCMRNGFRFRHDRVGNIFISFKRGKAAQPVVFTAHMDHPGFEILKSKGLTSQIGVMGGVNLDKLLNTSILIVSDSKTIKGKIKSKTSKRWMGKPIFRVETKSEVKKGAFAYLDLKNVRFKDSFIYTKSADNLMSVALLLDMLLKLKRSKFPTNIKVVLTRAEEVGFAGCIFIADGRDLRKEVPILVLETSNAKAGGVEINGGPVIRVGDKQSGFSPNVDAWLQMVAEITEKNNKNFKYQRAVLSGGRCEASAYMLGGYTAGGLAFPLGNYHNNGPKGFAPEFVGAEDYKNMLAFCMQLARAPKLNLAYEKKKRELWDNFEEWKKKF